MRTTKKDQQRDHAARRARERFGITFTSNDRTQLIQQIQTGKAKFVTRQSNRITVWDVTVKEVPARVIYDKQRKEIVTFLPEGAMV